MGSIGRETVKIRTAFLAQDQAFCIIGSVFPDAPGSGSAQRNEREFQTTLWTVVEAAGSADGPMTGAALARLCNIYWYPLYAYIRRQGCSPHEAEDLTQEFFCQFLERQALRKVERSGGRFRTFLLTCLKNFLINEREAACAKRRGGGLPDIPLEATEAETRYQLEPPERLTPDVVFDRRWAFAVIESTMGDLQREYADSGKSELFGDLQGFLPGGRGEVSRADLALKRGISVGAIDVALHRLRQRFGILLRRQVARTVDSEAEVEQEIRHLIAVLSR